MGLDSKKDFVIYKSQGEGQQSTSLEYKIKEVQQCYKAINSEVRESLENEEEEKEEFMVTFNKKTELVPNYMENEFRNNFEEDFQFGHIEEQRVSDIERLSRKQYSKENQFYDDFEAQEDDVLDIHI